MTDLPAAVLWDMDGTLVDTEPAWMAAEHALVAAHGGIWSDEQARSLVGSALLDAAAQIRAQGPVDLPPERIVELLLDQVVEAVHGGVVWRPGARELLAELNALGVPCVLVTMSYRRLAEAVVRLLPPGSFTALVTGDEVVQGKPHPEPYLRAAALVGAEPGECVALEDSPTGVASAVAAGVPTVAVPLVVAIAPAPGTVIVSTLDGVAVADLSKAMVGIRKTGSSDTSHLPR